MVSEQVAAVVLAAGKSTRMLSELPKVLHDVCGWPMLGHVIAEVRAAGVHRLIVVVGHNREMVMSRFQGDRDISWVAQTEQRGTGHAVLCCREALAGFAGTVLVIAGDMPLVRRETLAELVRTRVEGGDALTIATTELEDPTGYGRIVRGAKGELEAIVEDRDCTAEQRAICEVNPSYYCFGSVAMFDSLAQVRPSAGKGELYVTDTVGILRGRGERVSAKVRVPSEDAMGVNSRQDLAAVNRVMQRRLQKAHMERGVTVVSPENTWIEADVDLGRDTIVEPFSFIGAGARVAEGCRLGPFAHVARGETVASGRAVGPIGKEATR